MLLVLQKCSLFTQNFRVHGSLKFILLCEETKHCPRKTKQNKKSLVKNIKYHDQTGFQIKTKLVSVYKKKEKIQMAKIVPLT